MILGNIVSDTKLEQPDSFKQISIEEYPSLDTNIPTLIIGIDNASNTFKNFNILDKKIDCDGDIYWTFTKEERRQDYMEDLEKFITICYNNLISKIKYYYIDPIHSNRKTIRKILNKIKNSDRIVSYIDKSNMAYIYTYPVIFGINFEILNFMGISKDKMISKINQYSDVVLDDDQILIEYKRHLSRLGYQVKYVPFLYSVSHNE